MTLHEIKTELYKNRIKAAHIATKAGVAVNTVRVVINGHGSSQKVRQAVAELLNEPYDKLWGSDPHHMSNLTREKKACK